MHHHPARNAGSPFAVMANSLLLSLIASTPAWTQTPSDKQASAAAVEGPAWVLVAKESPWTARDSQGEVVFDEKLWLFGGWFNSFEAPPRDVWSSKDGRKWEMATDNAPWLHSDLSMSLVFRDKIWFMGGWYNGRLKGHSASNKVWHSSDGKQWASAGEAQWSPRIASAVAVFKNRMWLLGGTENYYFGDKRSLKNDVWSSADGKTWRQETAAAPWSPRAYHQCAVLNGRLYVFGGGNYVPDYHAVNDVWSSEDGRSWRKETGSAPWNPRLWFSSVVYRDRIWVLGGWSKSPSQNWGDVWFSKDGKEWIEMKSPTIWKARHEHSALVKDDKIWVLGGHAQPLSSEVWTLELP